MNDSPQINSFIIRFIHADAQHGELPYRGTIRHILSDESLQFTDWAAAEAFIRHYVPLEMSTQADPQEDSNLE